MEMNVSQGSGGRLSWVRGCGPVCVAAAGWRDLLATVETSARCSAVGGHRAVVTLPPLLPHHLHTMLHMLSQPGAWCQAFSVSRVDHHFIKQNLPTFNVFI